MRISVLYFSVTISYS